MNIQYDFSDISVAVTGAAQGIGFDVAKSFLKVGAKVCILDYNQEALAQAKENLKEYQTKALFETLDVSQFANCQQVISRLGELDVLVNNAGITRDKTFAKMTTEEFDQVIQTNLTGVFNVTKAALGSFREDSSNKRIINIASVVALYGNFGQANYVAAKAGVIGFTKTLARELGRRAFTVNAIAPGFTSTAMVAAMPKEVLDTMEAKVPLKRLGRVEDISNAVLFLASKEANYINGAVLSVDGGLVI